MNDDYEITEDDIVSCWKWHLSYFADLLNGKSDAKTAREDLMSLIGSKYDPRVSNE